jgi:hypothetical protein
MIVKRLAFQKCRWMCRHNCICTDTAHRHHYLCINQITTTGVVLSHLLYCPVSLNGSITTEEYGFTLTAFPLRNKTVSCCLHDAHTQRSGTTEGPGPPRVRDHRGSGTTEGPGPPSVQAQHLLCCHTIGCVGMG